MCIACSAEKLLIQPAILCVHIKLRWKGRGGGTFMRGWGEGRQQAQAIVLKAVYQPFLHSTEQYTA